MRKKQLSVRLNGKKKRLVFAMGHKDRTKVTWSDESRFVFFQNDQWIRQIK